jgi:hypothetical protein
MSGGFGDDFVIGGPGSDSIHSDILDFHPSGSGHRGNDVFIGGGGEDFFYANEGHRDTIFCGGGRDGVDADRRDADRRDADRRDIVAADCERVRGRG